MITLEVCKAPRWTTALLFVSLACGAHSAQAQSHTAMARAHAAAPALPAGSSPLFTFTFGMIDYPRQMGSAAFGVNKAGWVVGGYGAGLFLNTFSDHGFLLKGNTFSTIDYPGAAWTELDAINDFGEIVGVYGADYVNIHGFSRTGITFTSIDYPGAVATLPLGINKTGDIVGFRFDTPSSLYGRGFLLSKGVYTSIDFPGSPGGGAYGINSAGEIVGAYFDAAGNTHGYTLSAGVFTTIDYPGYSNTYITGINDSGLMTGSYGDNVIMFGTGFPTQHGFVYQSGQFTPMDAPFGPPAISGPSAISNSNVAVGGYIDNSGTYYGYQVKVAP